MTRKNVMRIILIVGSALILIGVTLMGWMLANREEPNVIEVFLADDKTLTEKFEALSLVPGEQCEYTVKLRGKKDTQYDLQLDFVETEEKTLKKFARVKILAEDQLLYDELLATAFEDEELAVTVDFGTKENTELTIVYYLPLDVGNEAKKAEAIFELLFTARIK